LTELLERVERESFSSSRLRALRGALETGGRPLSRRIARLQTFIAARDALRNEIARPFALMLLVRSQAAVAIDRWHAMHGPQLSEWLRAVGELEALASLATYSFEHPDDPFPTLSAEGPIFIGLGLGHPLIQSDHVVRNDVRLGGDDAPHVLVVSGSNMSGKSTLLRAVGANEVLAMAGGPVRARSLHCSPMSIGATIHVEDSLQAGRSRFYAEILRIRDIVDRTRGETPVLFLLDEILHGTNSRDRRIGAEAIVRTLVRAGAIGLVTTHDLALTELTGIFGARAENVHFEDRIEAGTIVFDYRMREGVVERSNALELMRAAGLDVSERPE
jgi:DNA mismatch repair ATPase MutS